MTFLSQDEGLTSVKGMIHSGGNSLCVKIKHNPVNESSLPEEMDLYFVEQYQIPRDVLEALAFEHGGDSALLAIQIQGIRMGLLDRGKLLNTSGIISGPTGSGKTLLAELRILARYFTERHDGGSASEPFQVRSKTIFLVPLKAIGLEKMRYFRRVYDRFGIQVLYSDGEVRHDDGKILTGHFDVAIMIQEKLKFFEQHNPEFYKNVGEVVVDELGMLSEKSRGPQLEIALAGLLLSPYKPSILALTTPLERIETLLGIIGGFLLETEDRPLDIRTGVWSYQKGKFESWSCNTGEPYPPEKWDLGYPLDKDRMLKEVVRRYKQGIMFALPSRALTLSYASRLSHLIDEEPDVRKVMVEQTHVGLSIENRLRGLEATKNKEQLTEYLKRGIGFHHADLSVEERKEVEDAFRNREIAVIFCTSTLARGINLPADTVIFLDWGGALNSGEPTCHYYGQLANEFTSWMGRIGRPGGSKWVHPIAIYLAQTAAEAQQIKRLILAKRLPLSPHLSEVGIDLTGHLLAAGTSVSNAGLVKAKLTQQKTKKYPFDLQDIHEFLSQTPSGAREDSRQRLLKRATGILVSLTNPVAGPTFTDLQELVRRLLDSCAKSRADNQSICICGRNMSKLVLGLQTLSDLSRIGEHDAHKAIEEVKSALKASLKENLGKCTLPEIANLFVGEDIYPWILRMIAAIRCIDKRYQAIRLWELGELLGKNSNLNTVLDLKRAKETLVFRIDSLVNHALGDTCNAQDLTWLGRIRPCRLYSHQLKKLADILESEEILGKLLNHQAYNTTPAETSPKYLKWIETEGSKGFQITHFGRICVSHGIATATCDVIYQWLATTFVNGKVREIEIVEFFRLLLKTFDGAQFRLLKTTPPVGKQCFPSMGSWSGKSLKSPVDVGEVIITCSALKDWIKGIPTIEIERKHSLGCGSLYEVARQVSRLIRACRDIAVRAVGVPEAVIETTPNTGIASGRIRIPDDLGDLAEMLLYGLPLDALPVAHLRVEGLTRSWIIDLLHGLDRLGIDNGLPTVERLQLLTGEQLRGMLPTRGLFKRLKSALMNYNKAPLAPKLAKDRQFILRYYLLPQVIQAQLQRGKPHYARQDRYTALRVVTRDGSHTVLRRNDPHTRKPLIIRDDQVLIDWVKRGAVDFYAEIGEIVPNPVKEEIENGEQSQAKYIVDRFFVDLDPHNRFPMEKLKAVAKKIYEFFEQAPQVEKARIYWSGGKGFHVIGFFKEGIKLEVQTAKDKLTALLNSWRICNEVDIFMELDPTVLEPYLTIDLSPIMNRGIYRNELSIHAVSGGCCVEVNSQHLQDFEPDIEAIPEAVMARLVQEMTGEERIAYIERVDKEIASFVHRDEQIQE